MAWYVLGYRVGIHFYDMVPQFSTVYYVFSQRGSYMVWEINMGVCPRLKFYNIMFINCLGYDFNIEGAFGYLCNSIANL